MDSCSPLRDSACGRAAAVSGDRIFISEGTKDLQFTREVWSYYPMANAWTEQPPRHEARSRHSMAAVAGRVYVFGGVREDEITRALILTPLRCFIQARTRGLSAA